MKPEQIVKKFMSEIRSGRNLDYVDNIMAAQVLAHQVIGEEEITVSRTPKEYAEHVREMIEAYGEFSLTIEDFLVQGDKIYVRWKQVGTHVGEVEGFKPTGATIIERASAVYRVEDEKIVEYWIQIDRLGIQKQLEFHSNMDESNNWTHFCIFAHFSFNLVIFCNFYIQSDIINIRKWI